MTIFEITKFVVGVPPASAFAIPAACAAAAAIPRPPTEQEKMAALTGGHAEDFVSAITGPGSKESCTVLMRVVRAGTMAPIASGFQVALDPAADIERAPHYETGVGKTWTFKGGGLHEITSQVHGGVLRLENPNPSFYLDVAFGEGGDASGFLYKQCHGPQTVLLLVVKNPDNLSEGAEWLWVKSGQYATVDGAR